MKSYESDIYRWMYTGTPLAYYLDSWIVLDYLYPNLFSENDEPFNSSVIQNRIMTNEYRYRHLLRNIIDKLFIRHTHQSVEKMKVDIPKPVINTEFLNFSEVERNFYDSLQDRGKKLQLAYLSSKYSTSHVYSWGKATYTRRN